MPIEEFPIPPGGVGGAVVESRPTQIVLLGNVPYYEVREPREAHRMARVAGEKHHRRSAGAPPCARRDARCAEEIATGGPSGQEISVVAKKCRAPTA